mmetsp:Transcript_174720/g.560375  ORF Transcript_174720/g.560375 Transcript_174720/m.560375 type:complete len:319 (-) Transcript_174720:106-1062(-)
MDAPPPQCAVPDYHAGGNPLELARRNHRGRVPHRRLRPAPRRASALAAGSAHWHRPRWWRRSRCWAPRGAPKQRCHWSPGRKPRAFGCFGASAATAAYACWSQCPFQRGSRWQRRRSAGRRTAGCSRDPPPTRRRRRPRRGCRRRGRPWRRGRLAQGRHRRPRPARRPPPPARRPSANSVDPDPPARGGRPRHRVRVAAPRARRGPPGCAGRRLRGPVGRGGSPPMTPRARTPRQCPPSRQRCSIRVRAAPTAKPDPAPSDAEEAQPASRSPSRSPSRSLPPGGPSSSAPSLLGPATPPPARACQARTPRSPASTLRG